MFEKMNDSKLSSLGLLFLVAAVGMTAFTGLEFPANTLVGLGAASVTN